MKVAILDDYQNVALRMADWSSVASRAEITVFNDHVADPEPVVERLMPFDVICVMRGAHAAVARNHRAPPAAQAHRLERAAQRLDRHGRGGGARHSRHRNRL